MSHLPKVPEWAEGVYQLERNDPVSGGPLRIDEKGKERGTANKPLIDLANRTEWLKEKYDMAFDGLGWQQLGLWALGLEVSLPTQIVNYGGSWYRYRGPLDTPHIIAGESPEEDGGIWSGDDSDGVWSNVGDASIRADLASSADGMGAALVHGVIQYFNTVSEMESSDLIVGKKYSTLGLRFKEDGGGSDYRIVPASGVRPESKGYKVTSYPNEFGDLELANGNIAIRLNAVNTADKIKIWAHRGGQRGVAENTMYSFSHAIQNGAHGVELDGCISADGVWYVFHDAYVSELTNGTGYVRDLTSDYIDGLKLKKLIGTRFENVVRIPRFSTFLEWAAENGVNFTVELKNKRVGQEEADFLLGIQMIVDAGCESFAFVQVTSLKEALLIREVSKQIVISYAFSSLNTPSDIVFICKDFDNVIIQSNTDAINEQFKETVRLIRALGSDVICYTSRDIALDINKALEAGCRNLISDRGWENQK